MKSIKAIPFVDLQRQYGAMASELTHAIGRVMQSGSYILGQEVELFEQEFGHYLGVSYAIGVASGTEAITLALKALDIKPGEGVIVPDNSLPSVWGVLQAGAVPVLVDVEAETFTLNIDLVEALLNQKGKYRGNFGGTIKAILAVHLYGRPVDMLRLKSVADHYHIPIIEDCAQAAGTRIDEHSDETLAGTVGHVGVYSFYPTKNLGAYGDGGMVATNNKEIAERVRLLRMYGEQPRYVSQMVGMNSRLDELQAALLRAKLPYLSEWNRQRRKVAQRYHERLHELDSIVLPVDHSGHIYHLYVIKAKKRDALRQYLHDHGIATMIHYPLAIHLQPSLAYLGYHEGDFPVTESITQELLSLPMFAEITMEEIDYTADKIRQYYSGHQL